jgi:hypothetical protein
VLQEREAEANGLVVVYGYSDDNVELAGAISDEIGAWEGVVFHVEKDGSYYVEDSDAPNRIRQRSRRESAFFIGINLCHLRSVFVLWDQFIRLNGDMSSCLRQSPAAALLFPKAAACAKMYF